MRSLPSPQQGWGWTTKLGSGLTAWVPEPPRTGMAVRQEGGKEVAGTHSCVCWGWGSRKKDRKLPPTPPPTSLSSNFCWTPSKAARGSPIPISPGQGWQGAGMGGRDSAPRHLRRGGGRSPPHPLEELRSAPGHPFPIRRKRPEEEARGSVKILAKVTAGRGMSALGSPSFQGANGLGSLSTLTNPTPWADGHLEFPAQLLFSGPHTSSHTHNEGPSCLLHTPLLCCQTFSHHTHTHTPLSYAQRIILTNHFTHNPSLHIYTHSGVTHRPPLFTPLGCHMHTFLLPITWAPILPSPCYTPS